MKCVILVLAFSSLITSHWLPVTVEAAQLLVGTAKLELTPPGKTPLAGYSRRRGRPATGIHDPLFVRALVIQHEAATVVLVSCDLLIIDERLFDAVNQRLKATAPLPPMSLLIAATHTHSGPGGYGQKFLEKLSMGHFDPRVFEFLSGRIAQAIVMASTQMQPVYLKHASTSTSNLVVNRIDPEGTVDPELTVLAFYRAHQQEADPIAVVVNFNAHATTLGSWNMQLSADYPGVLAKAVEGRYPNSVCLFFAGSVADQAPVKQTSSFAQVERLGTQLALQVFQLLEEPHLRVLDVEPSVAEQTIQLPPARLRVGRSRLPSWISRSFVDDDATLTLIGIGQVLVLGIPCDLSAELGLELKAHARSKGFQPFLIGFANDYVGYCLPERLYWTDTYEASLAFNGPTAGPMLVETLKRMIDHLGQGAGDGGRGK